jgi:hypothetical protein
MKEIGVGWTMRMAAKGLKPRLIISEAGGKWTLRSESTLKTVSYDFTPGVEFDETTPDGREVKVNYHFFHLDYLLNLFFFSQLLTLKVINGYTHQLINRVKNQL